MSLPLRLAFGCHLLGILASIGFGLVYLLRNRIMPYHEVALGQSWSEIPPPVQVLTVALMRAFSGAALGGAALGMIVLLIPFRAGEVWAFWAIPASSLISGAIGVTAVRHVTRNTPARPPLGLVLVGLGLSIVGLVLSLLPNAS
jgi:hypothetical protein